MSQLWRGENNWVNPPWELLDRVVQKLREDGASATVVAPYWPGASWFRELLDLSVEYTIEPAASDMFLPGRLGSCEAVGAPRWDVIVCRIQPEC